MVDQLEEVWNQILRITSVFVIPDWNDPIRWLPLLLLVGVVGPLLTLLLAGWAWYLIRRPRVRYEYAEPTRLAPVGPGGERIYPTGEPHCPRDGIVYAAGTGRCAECGDDLRVICPKCEVIRAATVDTCGNCGLSFTLKPVLRTARRSPGPPPGGAAVA